MSHLRPYLVEASSWRGCRRSRRRDIGSHTWNDEAQVVAVAGFRMTEMLSSGRTMYVDDLVTDEWQRAPTGTGRRCWTGLQEYAREAGCETFSLDSGTQRQEAHAFYFRERMRVTAFHFAKKL